MTLDDYIAALGLPLRRRGPRLTRAGLEPRGSEPIPDFAAEFIDLRNVPDDLPPRESLLSRQSPIQAGSALTSLSHHVHRVRPRLHT